MAAKAATAPALHEGEGQSRGMISANAKCRFPAPHDGDAIVRGGDKDHPRERTVASFML